MTATLMMTSRVVAGLRLGKEVQVSARISVGKSKGGRCALWRDIGYLGESGEENPRAEEAGLLSSSPSPYLDRSFPIFPTPQGRNSPTFLDENPPGQTVPYSKLTIVSLSTT